MALQLLENKVYTERSVTMNNKTEYKVLAFQQGQTKNGKDMWRITLENMEDKKPLTGVIWSEEIPRFDGTQFKTGNIIKFLGQDYNSNYNSVVIKNVTVVKEAISGVPNAVCDKYLKDILNYLTQVEEKYSKAPTVEDPKTQLPYALLASELKKSLQHKDFSITPAAERFHHNYLGGLLKHTYEVLHIVRTLSRMFPIEKLDALQLAAILHDLGKMYEYTTDIKLGTATIDQEWIANEISHVHWGYRYAHDCAAFDVARMVASHHGKIEWGAIFEPETPEEKVLHLADMISATIGITTVDKLSEMLDSMKATEIVKEVKGEENVHPTSNDVL